MIKLEISGIGIVFYSPAATQHIVEGTNFLSSGYTTEDQVQFHIQQGSIVGFCTGSPGIFTLRFHPAYPDDDYLHKCEFKLRLGLHCIGGIVCFRDLYDLLDWRATCPPGQILTLEDGFYHVTLCSDVPDSGILGDGQEINVYLQKLDALPDLSTHGIPTLCA